MIGFADFKLSTAARCLDEGLLTDPKWKRWWKAQSDYEITITDHMNGKSFTRTCAPIVIRGRNVWADKQTGTLYDEYGMCLSANLRTATVPKWHGGPTHGPATRIQEEE